MVARGIDKVGREYVCSVNDIARTIVTEYWLHEEGAFNVKDHANAHTMGGAKAR